MPVAATVFLSESNTAGPIVTDNVSNCNFGGVDVPNIVPVNYPIVRPNGGVAAYSFKKFWRIKVDSMGDSALIQNPKFWKTSGAYVLGEAMFYDGSVGINSVTPSQVPVGNGPVAVPTTEPSVNISLNSSNFTGTITAAPAYSNGYTVVQLWINSGGVTPIGAVNQKVLIFQYDES